MKNRPAVLDNWDEVQHDPLTLPPDNFSGMSVDEAVAEIRNWFYENFENPAETTPYESAEGGYQYIWGGPYETRDIIENVFADSATAKIIDAAIEELDTESDIWVPSSGRRRPPEEFDEELINPAALHAEMLRQAAVLEKVMASLPKPVAGIGHNNPPEPLQASIVTPDDQKLILDAVELIKAQSVNPTDNGASAIDASNIIFSTAVRIRDWLIKQGDVFITEAVKEGGKEFGKWAPRVAIALAVEHMFSLTAAVTKWLDAYGITLAF